MDGYILGLVMKNEIIIGVSYGADGSFFFLVQNKSRCEMHSLALVKRIIQRLSLLKTRCRQEYHYLSKCRQNINTISHQKSTSNLQSFDFFDCNKSYTVDQIPHITACVVAVQNIHELYMSSATLIGVEHSQGGIVSL